MDSTCLCQDPMLLKDLIKRKRCDVEESDDEIFFDENEFIDYSPFPDQCQNEIVGIDSLSEFFNRRYDACPAFFRGSLREACETAFSSTVIKERRPVLVYIHHDKSFSSNIFCLKTLCSPVIIDYLLENYIVWPWDITFKSNKNTLSKIWEEMFSIQFFDDLSIEEYPVLIGITRLFQEDKDGLLTSEYQFKSLLKGDTLTRNQNKVTSQMLLNELVNFKEECYENEQALALDFITKTGLCWDVILEIARYLSLNDAMNAFSTNILPILYKFKTKVHIAEPSYTFIKMILRKLNPEQIVSVKINAEQQWLETELASLTNLNKVTSISLLNLQQADKISRYEVYLTNLTCLSLWYDNETTYDMIASIISQLHSPIKRFEIHTPGALCTHYGLSERKTEFMIYSSIEYLLIDMSHFPLTSINNCFQCYPSCLLMTIIDFIRSMHNIHHVYLITNKYNLTNLLDVKEWNRLLYLSPELKKVRLRVLDGVLEDGDTTEKILEIQKILTPQIKFQVTFV